MCAREREWNFDGIVGPSHNYAGLSFGNVASAIYRNTVSNPRAAALEGLEKMRLVASLGIPQAVIPPLRRPRLELLRGCGFVGSDPEVIAAARREAPELLAAVYSASNMWTANAATVSPSVDCRDGRVHLSVANLSSTLHRAIEPPSTLRLLRAIFADSNHFAVHPALAPGQALGDEGAANHTRLYGDPSAPGIEMFAFGRAALRTDLPAPQKYPARQTLEACQAIARRHGLAPQRTLFVQQQPAAIDAGVFHNDVIAVGNRDVLLHHEQAFVNQAASLETLRRTFAEQTGQTLIAIEVSAAELPLADAVKSYLFNSQLVTLPRGAMAVICPQECREIPAASRCLDRILADENQIAEVHYVPLRQSMQNGGGPACLRLRVMLTAEEEAAVHPGVVYSEALHPKLVRWIQRRYRDRITPEDLADPALPGEIEKGLIELAEILDLSTNDVLDFAD